MTEPTYVSAVCNLGRRDSTTRLPPELLLSRGSYVLGLPVPLVLFVDPEFEQPCQKAREELGLGALTRIVVRPLESFELAALVPLLPRFLAPRNADSARKETPWYLALTWSKLHLVAEAIREDFFATDHFAWLDFGIAHVAEPPHRLPEPTERVALLEMLPVAPSEIEDRADYYLYERGRVAGGFLRGHHEAMLKFHHLFVAELAAALALGMVPNDQMIFGLLTAREPELFQPHYGDYPQILSNWDYPRDAWDQVMANAAFCRSHQLWSKALRVGESVESALAGGHLTLDDERTAHWLDELYVASWYGGRRERCRDIAHQLESLAATDYFPRQAERLRGNLALLDSL